MNPLGAESFPDTLFHSEEAETRISHKSIKKHEEEIEVDP